MRCDLNKLNLVKSVLDTSSRNIRSTVNSTKCTKIKSFGCDKLIPIENRFISRENEYIYSNALVYMKINVGGK